MKVTPEHLGALRAAIAPLDTPDQRSRYAARDIPRGDAVKDIDKRYRWDLLYASRALTGGMCATYDDAHIDTALRAIVPTL